MIADFSETSLAQLVSLAGRVAVVTGGAKGIGAATARRLAEAGATVVVGDLDVSGAAEVAGACQGSAVTLDVTDSASLAAAADHAINRYGRLDIWVNNAGVYPTTGPALDATDEFVDRMLEVNVRGTYAGAREAARRMTGGGVIVNLASTAGFVGATGISAYVASKHAVVGITKNLAIEFGPRNIRVVAVAPGPIDTPGVRDQLAPLKAAGLDVGASMSKTLFGRAGQPDDIARVILFLCSDLAAWVTGSTIPVEAGSLAGR